MADQPTTSVKRRSTGRLRALLIILAVASCVICLVLIRLAIPSGGPPTILGTPVCAATDTVNCDFVLNSRWAKIAGVPTSVLGLMYFGFVALWYGVVGVPNYRGRAWHLVPVAIVALGCCGSLGFLYVLAFQLPVWCTWCVAAHVVNLWLLILTILAWPRRGDVPEDILLSEPRQPSGARVGALLVFAVLLLVCAGLSNTALSLQLTMRQLQAEYLKAVNNTDYAVWLHHRGPRREVPVRPDDLAIGSPDAPFTLVVFGDFQCPYCQAFRGLAGRLVEKFPDRLRCVFKHYPLSTECNRHVQKSLHYFACAAARAEEAARAVGTPEQVNAYAMKLYANAGRLDQNPYESLASDVGIDRDRFVAALKSGVGRERIEEDVDLGHELGVENTPALFLNGRALSQWQILKSDTRLRDADATMALWDRLLTTREGEAPAEP
jgi:protein-disulfide isomerase/uncharacterized membrane protein